MVDLTENAMMASISQLWLFNDLSPEQSRRARSGTRERETTRYQSADRAYNRVQYLMVRWRQGKLDFPERYQFLTGCADLREFLRVHQADLWRIAGRLGLQSMLAVREAYGRAGWRSWSWDHIRLHEYDTLTEAGLASATNVRNLRPIICGENVRRGTAGEDPSQLEFAWT